MDKRSLLAIVLSLGVLFIYQTYFVKPPATTQTAPVQQGTPAAPQQAAIPSAGPADKAKGPAAAPAVLAGRPVALPAAAGAEKEVVVETPLYRAVFTSRGAALRSFQLKHYKTALADNEDLVDKFYRWIGQGKPRPTDLSRPIELVHVSAGMPRPLSLSFPDSTVSIAEDGMYEVDGGKLDIRTGAEPKKLTFSQTYPGELRIDKTFTFHPDKYSFSLEVRVGNLSDAPLNQTGGLNWYQYVDPAAPVDSYAHDGPVSYIAKSVDRPEVSKLEADKIVGPNVSWGGFESKYFIAALIPHNPSLTSLRMAKDTSNL
ncbi:MAG: membrane protein insertase YidC, partial [Thermodesulfobacteriota bacterium]